MAAIVAGACVLSNPLSEAPGTEPSSSLSGSGKTVSEQTGPAPAGPVATDIATATPPAFKQAGAFRPASSAQGNYLAGLLAEKRGHTQAAGEFMLHALELDSDNLNILNRAYLLMAEEGRFDKTQKLAARILDQQPDAMLPNLTQIIAAVHKGNLSLAEKRLRNMPEEGFRSYFGPLLLAWTLAGQGKTDQAIEALDPLSENSAFAILRELHMGLINDLADRIPEAEEHYINALASGAPTTFRLLEIFAGFFERTGNREQAHALYRTYKQSNTDWLLVDQLDGNSVDQYRQEKAVRNAREGMAEAFYNVASALHQESIYNMALIYARMALNLRPDMAIFRALVGEILEAQEQWAAARDMYRRVDPATPYRWLADIRIAMIHDTLGQTDEAIALLQSMADKHPERTDALINLGDLLRVQERYEEAVIAYDKAIAQIGKLGSNHWALLYARGISLERAKRWRRAESDLLHALELNPEQPYVLNYLGYSWVEQGVNLERALEMIERAVKLKPRDGYIVDSLGWALYHLGDLKQAVKELERAVELRPQDPTINDHLGDAYWRIGRLPEAKFQWSRALSFNPDEPIATRIQKKLTGNGLSEHTLPSGL